MCVLKGNSILGDRFISRFPDQSHIASIGSLEPPREERRDLVSPYREDPESRRIGCHLIREYKPEKAVIGCLLLLKPVRFLVCPLTSLFQFFYVGAANI